MADPIPVAPAPGAPDPAARMPVAPIPVASAPVAAPPPAPLTLSARELEQRVAESHASLREEHEVQLDALRAESAAWQARAESAERKVAELQALLDAATAPPAAQGEPEPENKRKRG